MTKKTLLLALFITSFSFAQKKILVFHETNQFRHGSINAGITMFQTMGNNNGNPIWLTDNSQTSNVFTTANLAQYDAVVFLNTSGSDESGSDGDLLSASEKLALENFIASGKGFIGIHAATDTYRDQVWPFYNELVGAIVQTSPNHTSNNFNANLEVKTSNSIIDFLGPVGSVWNKSEEYYYWEQNGGQLSSDNTVLLEVEETVGPNGMVNSYDVARPTTWFKESITYDDDDNVNTPDITLSGIKSFYTSLGHNSSDYNNNSNFREMIKNATIWAIGNTLSIGDFESESSFSIAPNPTNNKAKIHFGDFKEDITLNIFNTIGKQVFSKALKIAALNAESFELDISSFKSGVYFVQLSSQTKNQVIKLVRL